MYVFDDRIQAARTNHFNFCFELALDTNLAFEQLCRSSDFDRRDLLDFRRVKVDAARGIALPDAQLANREILNIEEHVLNASGANAHALSLFRRASGKSRNGRGFWILSLLCWQGVALVPTAD